MTPIEPIRKSVTIRRTPAEAFEPFTKSINEWWPLHTHSTSKQRAVRVVVEPGPGGRVYELRDDGQEIVWANGDSTSAQLEHSGWEKLADGAIKARNDYEGSWDGVLKACSDWCTKK